MDLVTCFGIRKIFFPPRILFSSSSSSYLGFDSNMMKWRRWKKEHREKKKERKKETSLSLTHFSLAFLLVFLFFRPGFLGCKA